MKRFHTIIIALTALCLLILPTAAMADDISDQLKQALKFYEEGKISDALGELDFAAAQLRQKKAEMLGAVFPEAPEGYKAMKPSVQAAGSGMLGGGISASREYRAATGGSVTLKVVTDSPILQSMAMMMSNPMFMQGGRNGKLVRIAGHKAILKERSDTRAEIQTMVNSKALVEVKVNRIQDATNVAKKFFQSIDMAKLSELIK